MSQTFDEKGLIGRIRKGDRDAWNEFVEGYGRLIYHSVIRTLAMKGMPKGPDLVQEIFQSIFVHLAENNGKRLLKFTGKHNCTLATWVRMISINYTIDVIRKQAGRAFDVDFEEVAEEEFEKAWEGGVKDPDDALLEKEKSELISACLLKLSAEERDFLSLYLSGLSPAQLAKLQKASINSVYSQYNRIKGKLKQMIMAKKV